jgi:hypothetical protein
MHSLDQEAFFRPFRNRSRAAISTSENMIPGGQFQACFWLVFAMAFQALGDQQRPHFGLEKALGFVGMCVWGSDCQDYGAKRSDNEPTMSETILHRAIPEFL